MDEKQKLALEKIRERRLNIIMAGESIAITPDGKLAIHDELGSSYVYMGDHRDVTTADISAMIMNPPDVRPQLIRNIAELNAWRQINNVEQLPVASRRKRRRRRNASAKRK